MKYNFLKVIHRVLTSHLMLPMILLGFCMSSCGSLPDPDGSGYREEVSAESENTSFIARELYRHGRSSNDLNDALIDYEDALDNLKPGTDRSLRAAIIQAQGLAYRGLGKYSEAINNFQQVIKLRKDDDPSGLTRAYGNLGSVYTYQGKYAKALQAYRDGLNVVNKNDISSNTLSSNLHNDIAMVNTELGDYDNAFSKFKLAISLVDESNAKDKGRLLHNMGYAHYKLGKQKNDNSEIEESVRVYKKALLYRRKAVDIEGEGKTLNSLGYSYAILGRYQEALVILNEALVIAQTEGDSHNIGRTLDSIAFVYMGEGEYPRALGYLYDALLIARQLDDRTAEHIVLANIGRVYQRTDRPKLAILFLKHSVAIIESIRKELSVLPTNTRKFYSESVADTYRLLTDLLLSQLRPLEAEQVIDLLRIEELYEYLGDARGTNTTPLERLQGEEAVIDDYSRSLEQALSNANLLVKLENIPKKDRKSDENKRIDQLRFEQEKLKAAFTNLMNSSKVKEALQSRHFDAQIEALQHNQLNKLSEKLNNNEVLFYPIVLPDRLERIYLIGNSEPIIVPPIYVSEKQLNSTILELRQGLKNPTSDVRELGQQLYEWLIKPIDDSQQGISEDKRLKTIVYAPYGMLRYIPLAALYDGNDYLVRKYNINLITALSISEFNQPTNEIVDVLAGAFTGDKVDIDVGDKRYVFHGLPFAKKEVEAIKTFYPDTDTLFDKAFSKHIAREFRDYQLVHLATHGVFVPGRPREYSFILFGDGERADLIEIQETWSLRNRVELMVLSACDTGIGGALGDGREIHGFGYLMQEAGANSVIASLWKVSDGGTEALMRLFYRNLRNTETSKVEALRQAQLRLIDGGVGNEDNTTSRGVMPLQQVVVTTNYSHPYYWAPFVLIGNGR